VLKTFGRAHEKSWSGPTLRIVVWNVYKGRRADWKNDLRRISSDADLVLLQELRLDSKLKAELEDEMFRGWSATFATQFLMAGDVPTGVLTLSRVAPSWTSFARSAEREPFVKSPKVTVLTAYPSWSREAADGVSGDSKILMANIHGLNFRSERGLENQVADVAHRLLSQDSEAPMIFAGDFNSKDQDHLKAVEDVLSREGFDRVSFAQESFSSIRDQAFVRGLKVTRARVLTEISSSDHKPLRFEVELPR
jgi:endonuclease/exonuclease/phosphatase (EEP) superfamily protein YafD